MAQNQLKYTNITYQDIVDSINSLFASDSRFQTFRESSVAKTFTEVMAYCVDLIVYYMERRAEESFFDTAKLKSTIIRLAKNLGYVVTRPIPAEANIKIKINGDLTSYGIVANDVLQIPIYTNFSYDNMKFLLKSTYNYTFTSTDVASISADTTSYEKILELDDSDSEIKLVQGEIKYKTIEGATNQQIGQKFQIYKIDDSTFSNKYGDQDYDIPVTKVYVGNTKNDNTLYDIDRRSLINWTSIGNFVKGSPNKVCLLRTTSDEKMELVFGDAQYAELGANVSAIGPTTLYDNIYLEYLSTVGSQANRTGIINEKLTTDYSIKVNGDNSKDITSKVSFLFNSNLINGADIESNSSIALSAPSIFYSLDRLVTKTDYINYLKSLTSPIVIKNAIAWGEQEEMITNGDPIVKLFNVALFSCLGSLYNLDSTNYTIRDIGSGIENAVLDLDFNPDEIPQQNYFNIYVKENVVEQLQTYDVSGTYRNIYGNTVSKTFSELKNLYDGDTLDVIYGSDYYLPTTYGLSATSVISLSATTSYQGIADQIETAFYGLDDSRGTAGTNDNFNDPLFTDMNVIWDSTNTRFIVSGGKNDSGFIGYLTSSNNFVADLGLNPITQSVSYSDSTSVISTKITDLIDNLSEKSQVTVRNVYISPIIQKFNLTGNIYVNQLSDRDSVHNQIKNSIYNWLDINADFNKNIYLSEIVQLIHNYSEVINVDIALSPEVPSGGPFFNVSTESRFDKPIYASEKTNIVSIFTTELTSYLTGRTTVSESEVISIYGDTIKNTSNVWDKDINERTFYNVLMKKVYDGLTLINSVFKDSIDFFEVFSNIHKDLVYLIRYNMLDSKGNIAPEYTIQNINGVDTKVFYKGGYSLGNEIPQIDILTNCIYKA